MPEVPLPTHLPLALQYIATSGWCAFFAGVLSAHPAGTGGRVVSISGKQDGEWEDDIHVALDMGGDRYLDAEGIRSLREMESDFGIAAGTARVTAIPVAAIRPDHQRLVEPIRALLDQHGWREENWPVADESCASTCWQEARCAFEALDRRHRDSKNRILACFQALVNQPPASASMLPRPLERPTSARESGFSPAGW